jgi:hypothetical protein
MTDNIWTDDETTPVTDDTIVEENIEDTEDDSFNEDEEI